MPLIRIYVIKGSQNVLNLFEDSIDRGSLWLRSRRIDSDLEGGGGIASIIQEQKNTSF